MNKTRLTVCWKFELLGSQDITADVDVIFDAWNFGNKKIDK